MLSREGLVTSRKPTCRLYGNDRCFLHGARLHICTNGRGGGSSVRARRDPGHGQQCHDVAPRGPDAEIRPVRPQALLFAGGVLCGVTGIFLTVPLTAILVLAAPRFELLPGPWTGFGGF